MILSIYKQTKRIKRKLLLSVPLSIKSMPYIERKNIYNSLTTDINNEPVLLVQLEKYSPVALKAGDKLIMKVTKE